MTGVIAAINGVMALIGVMTVLMTLPPRIQVTVSPDALLIEPEGLDVFWTVRRRVTIPIAAIESVRVVRRDQAPRPGIRLPGTYFPGLIVAGSFGTGANRAFWDVRRGQYVLLITCGPGSDYSTVVLEVRDPHSVAQRAQTVLPA